MPKVLQFTDTHIQPASGDTLLGIDTATYFQLVLEHAHNHHGPFDLMLATGDLAQTPCPDTYRRIQSTLSAYSTPCICIPGNHDEIPLMEQYLNSGSISCQRTRVLDNWLILCLDSQKPGTPEGQLNTQEFQFLQQQLSNHAELFTLIAVHHHAVPTDSVWLDTMIIEQHEDFIAALATHPQVKAVTCGHIHQQQDKRKQGVRFLGTPSTCFQFMPNQEHFHLDDKPPAYRIFDLMENGQLETHVVWMPITIDELDLNSQGY